MNWTRLLYLHEYGVSGLHLVALRQLACISFLQLSACIVLPFTVNKDVYNGGSSVNHANTIASAKDMGVNTQGLKPSPNFLGISPYF